MVVDGLDSLRSLTGREDTVDYSLPAPVGEGEEDIHNLEEEAVVAVDKGQEGERHKVH